MLLNMKLGLEPNTAGQHSYITTGPSSTAAFSKFKASILRDSASKTECQELNLIVFKVFCVCSSTGQVCRAVYRRTDPVCASVRRLDNDFTRQVCALCTYRALSLHRSGC